jgi:hypothetical protein
MKLPFEALTVLTEVSPDMTQERAPAELRPVPLIVALPKPTAPKSSSSS